MIEMTFEIFINLVEALISVNFITQYLGKKWNDNRNNLAFVVVWIISFIQMTIMNYYVEFETFGAYIPMVIYARYALICLKGNVLLKLWLAILTHLVVVVTSVMVNILLCNIIGYDSCELITVFNTTRIIALIIAKSMQFYVTRLILRVKHSNPIDNHRLAMLAVIPIISVISIGTLMKAALINNNISLYILVGIVCILIANIMTYYFFIEINKEYENKLKAKLLEQQNENLKNNISDNEAYINEMKTVRHDIKQQLFTISKYIDDNKSDEAIKYIGELTNDYLPHILSYIDTGNAAFDAVVNTKIAICNRKRIFMRVNVKNGTNINITSSETAVLFGNLLDNAIEAAQYTDDKKITMNIQNSESYLVISIKNSIHSSVLKDNPNLLTSKNDKKLHGIGIKSVKSVVKKYNGMIEFYEEENQFCCHIMMDINK